MPDTHDERGGDGDVVTPELAASELRHWLDTRTGTDRLGRDVGIVLDALAAATARAEKAEALVAERRPIRAEWSTENVYSHPSDDVISHGLAARRVIAHPNIHTAVLRRQLYAGPWLPAADACRSCGETERVLGDPPLCSNCAVHGPTYRGVACWAPIAAQDDLSEPVERSETSGASFHGNVCSVLPESLSGPQTCSTRHVHDGLMHICALATGHGTHMCVEGDRWTTSDDDTTEDGT